MNYRREVDGLRALAVVPVIFFHAGFAAFRGGFVGVDIFFVISGYLITSIIVTELRAGRFSVVRFYERRARRILPALFFVMACCVPVAWFWLLPDDFRQFARSVAAVAVFGSNVLFWRESGYFENAAELKPLLHTWSLAVEEQFYVLFPLLLVVAWRFGKRVIAGLLLLASIASLALAHWGALYKPEATFFLLPTRAWELAIGALAALYLESRARPPVGAAAMNAAGLAGIALIALAIAAFDDHTPFPSLYALVPTVGTVLVILFAWPETAAGRLLASTPFVSIGLVSYSAYLWHQPLFAFARHRALGEPSITEMLGLSVAALLLAVVSWRCVERPFREKPRTPWLERRAIFAYAVTFSVVFVVVGLALDNTRHYEATQTAQQKRLLAFLRFKQTPDFVKGYRYGTCFYEKQLDSFAYFDKQTCLNVVEGKRNWLLIGDSYAAHLWYGLAQNYPGINVMQATASGCRPLVQATGEKRCTDLMRYLYGEFLPGQRIDGVVLSARWERAEMERLVETVRMLKERVPNVIVIGPTVEYSRALPVLLAQTGAASKDAQRDLGPFLDKDRFAMSAAMQRALAGTGAQFVPLVNVLCTGGACTVLTDTNEPFAWDHGHFTLSGAVQVVRTLKERDLLRVAGG